MRLLLCFLFLNVFLVSAQPGTDIYLLEINATEDFVFVKDIRQVTDRKGYDNQPSFSPDGKFLYFSSNRKDQTDIYRVKTGKRKVKKVTSTVESEYSPVYNQNLEGITTVRVEKDSAQHLRLYQDKNCKVGQRLLKEFDSVAYYTWFGDGNIAMYILGDYLVVLDSNGNQRVEFKNPGRCLKPLPNSQKFSFVWKMSEQNWWLCALDETGGLEKLTTLEAPYEDYTWMPDGRLVWPQGSKIIISKTDELLPVPFSFDLSSAGIKGITRVAVSPDGRWLALVAEE